MLFKSFSQITEDARKKELIKLYNEVLAEIPEESLPEDDRKQSDVIAMLQKLLRSEYLQRDLYEAYAYCLFNVDGEVIRPHLKEHMEEEQAHVEILQRYLTSYGALPTLERFKIPLIKPVSIVGILKEDLIKEKDAVKEYSEAIAFLEGSVKYAALRLDLENILVQEQEHVHDIERWLSEEEMDLK